MKRTHYPKRDDFIAQHEKIGFNYWNLPSRTGEPYWQEGVVYEFSEGQIDFINDATQELYDMCEMMVERIVSSGDYPDEFALSDKAKWLIERSWKEQQPSIYGRFDLAYHAEKQQLKLLEFNGDTPTGLLEGSVAQWFYLEQTPSIPSRLRHQNNDMHEFLVAHWQRIYPKNTLVHFTTGRDFPEEDWGNLIYLMDTALEAGLRVKEICLEDIGITDTHQFVDLESQPIEHIFKLYPWEWLIKDEFSRYLPLSKTQWLEPAWKMLLSNKAMLVSLWKMFPHHPFLLEAHADAKYLDDGQWCKKAILGREGLNIYRVNGQGKTTLAQGSVIDDYTQQAGSIYQRWFDLANYDGFYPVIGSWIVGGQACGMSVREDPNLVTGDDAQFACHIYEGYAEM